MKALVIEITNLDEIACTETASQTNTFIPSPFIYRTAISGALLRVSLHLHGINYPSLYNLALNQSKTEEDGYKYLNRFYNRLLSEMLPDVTITDAILEVESQIRKEFFNIIYDGTSTALGSLKGLNLQLSLKDYQLLKNRRGEPVLREVPFRQRPMHNFGLYSYHFIHFKDIQLRRSLSFKEHLFRVPGAKWRLALIGDNQSELDKTFELLNVVLMEVGFGAKHSFRGKSMILNKQWIELEKIEKPIEAELFQPLICRKGSLSDNMSKLELEPIGGFRINWRLTGFRPNANAAPAVWGRFRAKRGYELIFKESSYIITEEDLAWPKRVCKEGILESMKRQ